MKLKTFMKIQLTIFILGIVLSACSVKPEPLVMGKDACHSCKMTLVDNKFGAEIVTKKGKIYKFDDLNCMLKFYNAGHESKENISNCLVAVYTDPTQLIDATNAFYVESELVKSPMAANIAAFSNMQEMEKFNVEWKGKTLAWSELSEQFK